MEFGAKDQRSLEEKTARELIWTSHHSFQGWTCSQCEWNYALPTLLHDPDARTAYDRLAAAKLRGVCAQGLLRTRYPNALDEVVPLLLDREPETRLGAVKTLATNGGEAGGLLLKMKVYTGDQQPEVLGECFAGLLAAASERSVTFVGSMSIQCTKPSPKLQSWPWESRGMSTRLRS